MKQILAYFFQGLLYTVPVAATAYVVIKLVSIADSLFVDVPIVRDIPGLGLVLVLALITLAGWGGSRFISPRAVSFFETALSKIPFLKLIYTSVRDLMKAFVGEKRKFDSPVLVQMDRDGLNNRLGFVTQSDLKTLGLNEMVAVYCPYPYSVMGDLIIVPSDKVRPLNGVNSVDLMKFVVSGGVAASEDKGEKK
ncbi:MAG: DUF502 domain-containing protein [Bacteroidales bacterium]|nr:DUF502 domain-containing protein [Bacteroidales bacterium]MDD7725516.1 DUF502 domain-containing protein [Bacteroidales bacterium]MDY4173976.1 DUF502 domain-containing protein [Bacteroidales bacterium]